MYDSSQIITQSFCRKYVISTYIYDQLNLEL